MASGVCRFFFSAMTRSLARSEMVMATIFSLKSVAEGDGDYTVFFLR
jgi:hypothetical protein